MAAFEVRIVTPEDVHFSGEATSLVAPGAEGYLGVLAHHAPLVTPLGKGTVTVRSGAAARRFAVDGGFLEVSRNRALLLVEKVADAEAPAEAPGV
jgi:F-type H+-transporting ATPase subunit epsilon